MAPELEGAREAARAFREAGVLLSTTRQEDFSPVLSRISLILPSAASRLPCSRILSCSMIFPFINKVYRELEREESRCLPRLLGVHMEGPYIAGSRILSCSMIFPFINKVCSIFCLSALPEFPSVLLFCIFFLRIFCHAV